MAKIIYTRVDFGKSLKEKVYNQEDVESIGIWAHTMYIIEHIEDIDLDFVNILLTLNTMELGPQFAFSYEELNKIADDLIAGRKPDL